MSFRTITIENRSKLDLKMNYLEVRGEETKRVFLDEIDILIIENPAVSMTGCLLEALIQKKINVIFCDKTHNPLAGLIPFYGSHDCSRKLKIQVNWDETVKGEIWTKIVQEKICKQRDFLKDLGKEEESRLLSTYIDEIQYRDQTNREGHAAKVYFNAVFGMEFSRDAEITDNAALDYGYALILSCVTREIVANGYSTQLGLFHDNIYNPYNLASDLMEPFRIIVDRYVKKGTLKFFDKEEKHYMIKIFEEEVTINHMRQVLPNAIKIYVKSVLDALTEKEPSYITFYSV